MIFSRRNESRRNESRRNEMRAFLPLLATGNTCVCQGCWSSFD